MSNNRSGGPRTAEGKKRVSQNALKIGAYTKQPVLPHENPQEFVRVCADYERDLKPQDIAGKTFVRELATITWKLMRINHVENEVLSSYLQAPLRDEDLKLGALYIWRQEARAWIKSIPFITDEFALQAAISLKFAIQIQNQVITPEIEAEIEQYYPVLHDVLKMEVPQWMVVPHYSEVNEELTQVNITHGENACIDERLLSAIGELKRIVWLANHKEAILKEWQAVYDARLLAFMERISNGRVQADLRREFGKTLARYRTHEEWRQDRMTVDLGD